MEKWFINTNNRISGPFNTEEVKAHIQVDLQNAFVWSRGLTEWVPASQWNPQVLKAKMQSTAVKTIAKTNPAPATQQSPPQLAKKTTPHEETMTATVIPSQAVLEDIKTHVVEKYKVRYDEVDQKEMTRDELIQFAAQKEDPSKISILDRKAKEWKELYTLPEIANKLGISRRQHQRVPILAHFTGVNTINGQKLNVRVVSVSQGGFGLTDNFDLKLGEGVKGQISSPHFYTPITIEAEVTYSGQDGYVGLKFTQINDEGVSLITDYVKRFGKAADHY